MMEWKWTFSDCAQFDRKVDYLGMPRTKTLKYKFLMIDYNFQKDTFDIVLLQ